MTPERFEKDINTGNIASCYLFIGAEPVSRDRCKAVLSHAIPDVTYYDGKTTTLAAIFDDARQQSLFATRRVIYVQNAEELVEVSRKRK